MGYLLHSFEVYSSAFILLQCRYLSAASGNRLSTSTNLVTWMALPVLWHPHQIREVTSVDVFRLHSSTLFNFTLWTSFWGFIPRITFTLIAPRPLRGFQLEFNAFRKLSHCCAISLLTLRCNTLTFVDLVVWGCLFLFLVSSLLFKILSVLHA